MFRAATHLFHRVCLLAGVFLSVLPIARPGYAQSDTASRRVALLIGVANYDLSAHGVPRLVSPVRDADAVADILIKSLGFARQDVEVLHDADKAQIEQAVARLSERARGAQTAVFYFSGHGASTGEVNQNYLLPATRGASFRTRQQLINNGYALELAIETLRSSAPQRALFIVDACRSIMNKGDVKGMAKVSPNWGDLQFIAQLASQPDGVAQDNTMAGLSRYTYHLIQRLPSAAYVSLQDLLDDVRDDVRVSSANEQVPSRYGEIRTSLRLVGSVHAASAAAPAVVVPTADAVPTLDPDQEAWALAKRRDTAQSYQGYLDAFPSGKFARAAEATLVGLRPTLVAQTGAPSPLSPPAQAGVTRAPAPVEFELRYAILNNGSEVRDVETRLIWQRCSVGQTWNGSTCAGEAKHFTFDQAQKLAGSGWRVPTIRELHSLIWCSHVYTNYYGNTNYITVEFDGYPLWALECVGKPGEDYLSPTIPPAVFPNTPRLFVWSGSRYAYNLNDAAGVSFDNGHTGYSGSDQAHLVRLVRGGP